MASGNGIISGSRIGAGPAGEPERGEAAPRRHVSFWCANGHQTRPAFAGDAPVPETWECTRCGNPAGQDRQAPPPLERAEPYKTHLAYVKDRRSAADGEAILAEALARLRGGAPAAGDQAGQDGEPADSSSRPGSGGKDARRCGKCKYRRDSASHRIACMAY